MKKGDLLVYQWGYEQTNVCFFEVIKATKATVTLQKVSSKKIDDAKQGEPLALQGKVVPVYKNVNGSFVTKKEGETLRKKVKFNGEYEYIKLAYGIAVPWDGTAQRYTAYN